MKKKTSDKNKSAKKSVQLKSEKKHREMQLKETK